MLQNEAGNSRAKAHLGRQSRSVDNSSKAGSRRHTKPLEKQLKLKQKQLDALKSQLQQVRPNSNEFSYRSQQVKETIGKTLNSSSNFNSVNIIEKERGSRKSLNRNRSMRSSLSSKEKKQSKKVKSGVGSKKLSKQ
jgi:hypothetical protein